MKQNKHLERKMFQSVRKKTETKRISSSIVFQNGNKVPLFRHWWLNFSLRFKSSTYKARHFFLYTFFIILPFTKHGVFLVTESSITTRFSTQPNAEYLEQSIMGCIYNFCRVVEGFLFLISTIFNLRNFLRERNS